MCSLQREHITDLTVELSVLKGVASLLSLSLTVYFKACLKKIYSLSRHCLHFTATVICFEHLWGNVHNMLFIAILIIEV